MEEHQFRPENIFNFDETMLIVGKKKLKVFTRRDGPVPVAKKASKSFEHITLGVTVSASGFFLTPLVILPLQTLPELSLDLQDFYAIAGQSKGWIDTAIFRNTIEKIFVAEVDKKRIAAGKPNDPVLLIVDQHSSRIGLDYETLFEKHNIYVLLLPPHSSTLLQPLDLSVFGEFKDTLSHRFKVTQKEARSAQRQRLLTSARGALERTLNPDTIKTGWRRSGLWPITPDKHINSPLVVPDPHQQPSGNKKRHSISLGHIRYKRVTLVPAAPLTSILAVKKIRIHREHNKQTGLSEFSVME